MVDKPNDVREISAIWVLKIKRKPNGQVTSRFKARLVARGYDQKQGIDYKQIFAPVVKMESLRLSFSLAAQLKWRYKQIDVKTAFLESEIDKLLYLQTPEGINLPTGKTLKLVKSIYGLKQAPKCWNDKFTQAMKSLGMRQIKSDPCIFKRSGSEPV